MTVKISLRDKTHHVKAGMTVRHTLEKLNIDPEAVLAVRAGELITDDVVLKKGDEIRLVAVISGG